MFGFMTESEVILAGSFCAGKLIRWYTTESLIIAIQTIILEWKMFVSFLSLR